MDAGDVRREVSGAGRAWGARELECSAAVSWRSRAPRGGPWWSGESVRGVGAVGEMMKECPALENNMAAYNVRRRNEHNLSLCPHENLPRESLSD